MMDKINLNNKKMCLPKMATSAEVTTFLNVEATPWLKERAPTFLHYPDIAWYLGLLWFIII